jgi:hypothetical protein
MNDEQEKSKEFIDGFFAKEPKRDFIKCSISIKKDDFTNWYKKQLQNKEDDWINIDVKEGKSGKWYAQVNTWKPKMTEINQSDNDLKSLGDSIPDDIPF